MKTFVISLERCHDRREHMKKILNEANIEFEFFNAIDGNKSNLQLRKDYNSIKSELSYGHKMNSNEIAIFLSHINIYKKIVKENISKSLIF